jgi:hypothetical protein
MRSNAVDLSLVPLLHHLVQPFWRNVELVLHVFGLCKVEMEINLVINVELF